MTGCGRPFSESIPFKEESFWEDASEVALIARTGFARRADFLAVAFRPLVARFFADPFSEMLFGPDPFAPDPFAQGNEPPETIASLEIFLLVDRFEVAIARLVVALEELAGVGRGSARDFLGPALGDQVAAIFAAFGAEVDDPVGVADDVEIVLDDDDGVAEVGEAVEHLEQLADVVEVQAGGGLVEEVERAAGLPLGELAGELHALRFAAGERGGALAEVDVAEADVDERLQLLLDAAGCRRGRAARLRWRGRGCRRWSSR